MWRELRLLAEVKPLVASMSDVAGSGGYYISMAATKIIAEGLTLTGSIGVITGKFQKAELHKRVGFAKERISRGRLAEVNADDRDFTDEELKWVKANALNSYEEFRDKAAHSRGMSNESMEAVAQGRVWTGRQAVGAGLVDGIGGLWSAIALAKRQANITNDVSILEAGVKPAKVNDVVGTFVVAACRAIVRAALGSDAEFLHALSLFANSPQTFALGIDRIAGKSGQLEDGHFMFSDDDEDLLFQ